MTVAVPVGVTVGGGVRDAVGTGVLLAVGATGVAGAGCGAGPQAESIVKSIKNIIKRGIFILILFYGRKKQTLLLRLEILHPQGSFSALVPRCAAGLTPADRSRSRSFDKSWL